jgi:anti-anti-sigma regulatory factor
MLNIHLEVVGDVSIVQCQGRMVRSDSVFRLRDVILSQRKSRVVVVDLSEVEAIEGGAVGMLSYLHQWAQGCSIKLKLFNPSGAVLERLEHTFMPSLDIATTDELIALLDLAIDAGAH